MLHLFQKGKATCFAYGQTGSGKTHTMLGRPDGNPFGIYFLAVRDIFRLLSMREYQNLGVFVSFYEIYGGKLFDLLNARRLLHAREDASHAVNIVGLKETNVENAESLLALLAYGNSVRATGSTGANADSSRSHAVLQITLKDVRTTKMHGMRFCLWLVVLVVFRSDLTRTVFYVCRQNLLYRFSRFRAWSRHTRQRPTNTYGRR